MPGHVLDSRDTVMKTTAMVPAFTELIFYILVKKDIHIKTLTSAFKKLIRLTKQNVIIIKSVYVGGYCNYVVQQRKGTV